MDVAISQGKGIEKVFQSHPFLCVTLLVLRCISGTHASEVAINKQLADKERVVSTLMQLIVYEMWLFYLYILTGRRT